MVLLLLLPFAAGDAASSPGATLLGVAAIIGAVVPIVLAVIKLVSRNADEADGDEADSTAALDRLRFLQDTVTELKAERAELREDGRLMRSELQVKDMRIGQLEALLATAKSQIRAMQEGSP